MRSALIAALCLAVLAVPAWAAAPGPRAELSDFSCVTALDPVDRSVSVKATMYPLGSPSHLAMLPVLLRRQAPSRSFQAVAGGQLGHWIHPTQASLGQNAADVWIVNLPVVDLLAPAHYRLRVRFRWLDAHGRTLAARTAQTATCYQPELRPDLALGPVKVTADRSAPGRETYSVAVRNRGASAAGHFSVSFTEGAYTAEKPVPGLASHARTVVRFTGASCDPSVRPRIVADAQALVDDADRSNNVLTLACG